MTIKESAVQMHARMMATDADLMKICNLTPEALERYRPLIEAARAEALVTLRYERARQTARRAKANP